MYILNDPVEKSRILAILERAGVLEHRKWQNASGVVRAIHRFPWNGYHHTDGICYWGVDVSRMLPIYQELYRDIYARRLRFWGADAHPDVGLLFVDGLILFWGPDAWMRAQRPANLAWTHLEQVDVAWFDQLEHTWHTTALSLESAVDTLWSMLCHGEVTVEATQRALSLKAGFNALGIDALVPPLEVVEAELAPWLADRAKSTAAAFVLPKSGLVAYDLLEDECLRLARTYIPHRSLPSAARDRFIRCGLFYLYDALDTERKSYFFQEYPQIIAQRFRQCAPIQADVDAQMAVLHERPWRRRCSRQASCRQLDASVSNQDVRCRLHLLAQLLGTTRDYDEEKRRINMKFWRALFALADGLGLHLTQPDTTRYALFQAIKAVDGKISIDATFQED